MNILVVSVYISDTYIVFLTLFSLIAKISIKSEF